MANSEQRARGLALVVLMGLGVLAAIMFLRGQDEAASPKALGPDALAPEEPIARSPARLELGAGTLGQAGAPDEAPAPALREALLGAGSGEAASQGPQTRPEQPPILGIVVDAGSGEPIEGAEILMGSFVLTRVVTDAEGHFDLPLENGILWNVRVRAAGYSVAELRLQWEQAPAGEGGRAVIELEPSGRIEGTVTTTDDIKVTSGRVYAFPAGSPMSSWMAYRGDDLREDPWSESLASAMNGYRPLNPNLALASFSEIDAQGRFELESLPDMSPSAPAIYDLVVRSDEVVLTCIANIEVSTGETKHLEIHAHPSSRIEGRIRFPPGTDHAQNQLWFCWHEWHLARSPPNGRGWLGKDRVVRADKNGHFNSGPLWSAKHVKIRAVLSLENQAAPITPPMIYDWDLELGEAEVLNVELAPGDDVRYVVE